MNLTFNQSEYAVKRKQCLVAWNTAEKYLESKRQKSVIMAITDFVSCSNML